MARLSKTGGKAGKKTVRKAKARKAGPAKGRKSAATNISKRAKANTAKTGRRAVPAARPRKLRPVSDLIKELKEARAHQAATAEILGVINASKGDLTPVFDIVLEKAHSLCDVTSGSLQLLDDDHLRAVAVRGMTARFERFLRQGYRITEQMRENMNRMVPQNFDMARRLEQSPDQPAVRESVELGGIRTLLFVPLKKNGITFGRITAARLELRPFTDKQIALLQSFADQAVIAIENARLLTEQRESLEQQIATAEILRVINSSRGDLAPVFDIILEKAHRLCDVSSGSLQLLHEDKIRAVAVRGMSKPFEKILRGGFHVSDRLRQSINPDLPVHIPDLAQLLATTPNEPAFRAAVELEHIKTTLSVALAKDGIPLGRIVAARKEVRPFTDKQIALLQGFADQAVIAIENARLLTEQREALERQTATADILRVIASSPDDVQPVFDAIAERSNRLVDGFATIVLSIADGTAHLSAFTPTTPAADAALKVFYPQPLSALTWTEAVLSGKTYLVTDTEVELAANPAALEISRKRGWRSALFVPLLRDGKPVGVIGVTRADPGAFADHHVQLLQTFADQAVIAISNVGLFNEVQESSKELSEALQFQTATSDVMKVISRSAFNLQTVLDTLTASATELCEADYGMIFLREGDIFHAQATSGAGPEFLEFLRANPRRLDDKSMVPRVARTGALVHIPDRLLDPDYQFTGADSSIAVRQRALGGLARTMLGVPLLRDGFVDGVFVVCRHESKPFTQRQIELVEGFSDQAVIALGNVRLFQEVQARTRDLSESLQQQTATADVLKVISRSTFDLQTVLETLVKSAVELSGANRGSIFLREGDVFPLKAASHTTPEFLQYWAANPPRAGRGSATNRVIASGKVEIIPDVLEDPEMQMPAGALVRIRATLGVPMLRDNKVEGVLVLTRPEPGLFSRSQIDLVQTFADQAVIAVENVRLFDEAQARTRELAASLEELRTAQDRLVQTEKLASLGQLTAGIAHEIKNPLNFVNNFSSLSTELIDELDEALAPVALDQKTRDEVGELTAMLKSNLEKVVQHGKRADSIVKNMLLHSREGSGEHRATDINGLVEESLNLAYHGARAEKPSFNITLIRDLDPEAGAVDLYPQEITRALLNFITNGFYATARRKADAADESFEPALHATTKSLGKTVQIRIRDNGTGIPPEVREKMFNPFFTTKPAGEGTGLGLSMSHDIIVKQHGGRIEVETEPGAFTEFIVTLPRNGTAPRA